MIAAFEFCYDIGLMSYIIIKCIVSIVNFYFSFIQ